MRKTIQDRILSKRKLYFILLLAAALMMSQLSIPLVTTASGTVTVVENSTTGTGNNQFEFVNNWSHGATDSWSKINDAFFQLRFDGTQVNLVGAKAKNHGIAAISIDGGVETTVDLYAPSRTILTYYTSPVLPKGPHTVKVRVTNTKNSASSDKFVVIDRAEVTAEEIKPFQEPPLIPKPSVYTPGTGNFGLTSNTSIYVQGTSTVQTDEIYKIGEYLASKLRPSTGFTLNVVKSSSPPSGSIYLTTIDGSSSLGQEGYHLNTQTTGVKLSAHTPEGLFRGIQTIRQLLPADVEKSSLAAGVSWTIPNSSITDSPAYPYRGYMLDVARHFFTVNEVKRMIDLMAQYKMNKFHIHLTDDQGWRIQIHSWPKLALIGGSKEVGGGTGGYYTQEQYTEIVNYAKDRYITIIPEIDMPGHVNAALASYGELNPNGQPKSIYTGTDVGFSSLMTRSEITYQFVDDVIREIAALTPGEYIHIGGDEAHSTNVSDYNYFIGRVNTIVSNHGKKVIGWAPSLSANLLSSGSVMQAWHSVPITSSGGVKIIMSPAQKSYLDIKYNVNTPIGLKWAGYNPIDDSYLWDPTDFTSQSNVIGVEAPLWAETVKTKEDIEYMTFPRLPGHAEVGWTAKNLRNWNQYKLRLKAHGPRMTNQGINFYADPALFP